MPFGWKGVFLALSSGGVIFACLGFEQAVQLGGETATRGGTSRSRSSADGVAIALYIALQVAFIRGARPFEPREGLERRLVLRQGADVRAVRRAGDGARARAGSRSCSTADAFVSPGGTGLLYTGASARLIVRARPEGYIPGLCSAHAARRRASRSRSPSSAAW